MYVERVNKLFSILLKPTKTGKVKIGQNYNPFYYIREFNYNIKEIKTKL